MNTEFNSIYIIFATIGEFVFTLGCRHSGLYSAHRCRIVVVVG